MTEPSAASITPPRQKRSQQTLEALLQATGKLLETRSFKDVTVAAVVREAGSSSGSFYARFADKSALLHALHERFGERAREQVRSLVADVDPAALSFEALTLRLVEELVHTHAANRGVLRAALMEALVDPSVARRVLALTRDVAEAIAPVLDACEPSRELSAARVETGLQTVVAVLDQDLFLGSLGARGAVIPPAMREPAWLHRIFLAALEP